MVNSEMSTGPAARPDRWRSGVVEWLVFGIATALAALIVWRMEEARLVGERERALHLAQGHAQVLQGNVERMVSLNHALAALVHQGEGSVANFDAAAGQLLLLNPRVVALSIAPGGVVRYVVPRQRNERLLGFDALNDPAQQGAAIFARDTGRLGLAGPMRLAQGGIGFVSRMPIYFPDGVGGKRFWGFTNATILQTDLLSGAALNDLAGLGFEYALWKLEPESGSKQQIAGSTPHVLERPVRQSLEVPNGAWNLDLAPVGGWRDWRGLALEGVFGLLASALLAYCARMLMAQRRYKAQLEEQVALRTAEILSTQDQLKSTLDAIRDPIYELGLDGTIHSCSAPIGSPLPAPPEELIGKTVCQTLPEAAARTTMEALQIAHADGFSQGEQYSLNLEDGRRWFELSVARKAVGASAAPRFVVMTRDITGSKSAKQEIRRLAFYDPLTDLPNRRLLQDRLEHALAASLRNRHHGALLLIDLDNFKALNDTMGHDKGDLLLQQVARRLQTSVRDSDTVARLGGDEFVVLVDDVGRSQDEAVENATIVATKILEVLGQPFAIAGREHLSSSSIGVSLFGESTTSVEEAFKRSDVAMYQAKAAGRNTLRFFDPRMQAAVDARAALEVDLRQALANNELTLHFQPQVGPRSEVVGAEALLRWSHPVRGQVPPGEFIPVAEQSGLVIDIGQWVLRTACAQLAVWAGDPATRALTLAVNVSVHQFRQTDFVAQVSSALQEARANPERLKLEITESMFAFNLEDIIGKMTALKAYGVGFSLDDFGTGYSSLSYLKRLPLDQLKIDQSFVRDVLTDPNDAAIARTIVALGQSLNLAVMAEGVETAGQHEFLLAHGCHYCQGYLFSRPLPEAQFRAFLHAAQSVAAPA